MKSNSELRSIARNSLKGNWIKAVVVCLILFSIIGIFTMMIMNILRLLIYALTNDGINTNFIIIFPIMTLSSLVIGLFFGGPLIYGFASFFLNLVRSKDAAIENIFDGFKRFWECVRVVLFIFLWSLIFSLPMFIISFLMTSNVLFQLSEESLIVLSILTSLASIIIFIVFVNIFVRYILVFYLIKDSEKTKPLNYLKQSKVMMKGRVFKFIFLNLSFIGWFFLSAFTCGIGILFLISYMNTTFAVFYGDLLEESKINNNITYVTLKNNDINQFYSI